MRLLKLVFLALFVLAPAHADRLKPGDWIGSAGIGFVAPPGMFLLSPHLEKVYRKNLFFGALIQAGFGGAGAIFSVTGTARLQVGHHPRLRPVLEGGFGMSSATAGFNSTFGINLHMGMGVDYLLESDLALSTIIRANFAPPVQTFFLSWPVLQVRYLF